MYLSIVASLYQSADNLPEFHERISRAARKAGGDYEIILVNDGSPDHSLAEALRLYERDPHVQLIDLARNFGHQKALLAGLERATGELVFLIDADLEEDPELLETFLPELKRSGADVVYGVQRSRRGHWFERLSGWLYFSLIRSLSKLPIPRNVVLVRLMTARYVSALLQHRENAVILSGLFALTGFEQVPISITKSSRSVTTYTFSEKLHLLGNAVTAFTDRPLWLILYMGVAITLASAAAGVYLASLRLRAASSGPEWAFPMAIVGVLAGLIILSQGVIGLYVADIFAEVKNRPRTIVRRIYDHSDDSSQQSDRGRQ